MIHAPIHGYTASISNIHDPVRHDQSCIAYMLWFDLIRNGTLTYKYKPDRESLH